MKHERTGFRTALSAACLLAVAIVGGGCLHKGDAAANATAANNAAALPDNGPVRNQDRYRVKAITTPFYLYGPQQLNGSDADLTMDTRITMVQHGHGYSRVRMTDGKVGYVGTEDITPLDANEIAAEDAAKLAAAAALAPPGALTGPVGPAPGAGGPRYTIPAEAGRSEILPTQDANATPPPKPPQIFRY